MEWSGLEDRQCLELLSWQVDVEWCSVLFPKESAISYHPGDVDWDTLATSLGLVSKVPILASETSSTFGHVKVAGLVVLISLGSYLCYRLYKVWPYRSRTINASPRGSGNDNTPSPSSSFVEGPSTFSYHLNNPDSSSSINVETRYFGPMGLKNDDSEKYNEDESSQVSDNMVQGRRAKQRLMRNEPPSPSLNSFPRGWLTHKLHNVVANSHAYSGGKSANNSASSTGASSSPISHRQNHSLSRDLSFDSLGLFNNSRRQSSLDSMCSELSFDMPSFTDQATENVTIARLDRLQEEIDQLKSNCLMMDEEFETVKCNRNLPGLSDLMESTDQHGNDEPTEQDIMRQQSARACFKGMYSLVNQSILMDVSTDEDTPNTTRQLNEEEHCPSLEWDDQNNWAPDQPEEDVSPMNVGSRVDVMSYAQEEWTSNTLKANTILRGYREIVDGLQYRYMRKIRADSYSVLRSVTFQVLAQGLEVPSSADTLARLSNAHNIGRWQFNSLPQSGTNIIRKMEICLQSLDNVCALCQSNETCINQREQTLYNLLNRDPSLDLHMLEAVKLHMMATALDIQEANSKGTTVPFFSSFMSPADISEMPMNFMNNHFTQVENSCGLKQVDMVLLGYTLGVSIMVVRPGAYGTHQLICSYPEVNVDSCPEVALLTEDDCHYDILCT